MLYNQSTTASEKLEARSYMQGKNLAPAAPPAKVMVLKGRHGAQVDPGLARYLIQSLSKHVAVLLQASHCLTQLLALPAHVSRHRLVQCVSWACPTLQLSYSIKPAVHSRGFHVVFVSQLLAFSLQGPVLLGGLLKLALGLHY